jgi:hypothetical protein
VATPEDESQRQTQDIENERTRERIRQILYIPENIKVYLSLLAAEGPGYVTEKARSVRIGFR